MFCNNCGEGVSSNAKFCGKCGGKTVSHHTEGSLAKIKCGNCEYTGPGENNRRLISKILAWCAVLVAPLVTIIYFVANPKYRCAKCKSTFVGIQNAQGVFDKQGTNKALKYTLYTLVTIAVVGLISTIIAAPIQNARKKASLQDTWIKYVSTEDSFNIVLPKYPNVEKKENMAIENSESTYAYHEYEAVDGETSYFIFKYIYSDGINTEDQDKVLNLLVNGMVNATDAKNPISSFGYYRGYRSVDFSFTAKGEMVKGRAILVGETPYLLIMDYYAANYKEEDYKKFIDSLTLN